MKDAVHKAYMETRRLLAEIPGLLRDFVVDTVRCVFSGIVRTVQFMLAHPFMTIGIAASLYLVRNSPSALKFVQFRPLVKLH